MYTYIVRFEIEFKKVHYSSRRYPCCLHMTHSRTCVLPSVRKLNYKHYKIISNVTKNIYEHQQNICSNQSAPPKQHEVN